MRADAKTSDIAIAGQAEAVAEIVVVATRDQRVAPARSAVYALAGQQAGVQGQVRAKSPSAKAAAQIGKLVGRAEHAVEEERGAGVRRQRRLAALKKYIASSNVRADRDMQHVAHEAEGPVADLGCPHERHALQVSQHLVGPDTRVDLGLPLQWRLRRGIDAGEPEIWRYNELEMPE